MNFALSVTTSYQVKFQYQPSLTFYHISLYLLYIETEIIKMSEVKAIHPEVMYAERSSATDAEKVSWHSWNVFLLASSSPSSLVS
jgi:hypothetical protein